MKEVFDQIEAEVDQLAIDKKYAKIKKKNLLIENDNLIAECLSKDVFYNATNYVLTVSKFFDMHDAYTVAHKRITELEAGNSNQTHKISKDGHDEMNKQNNREVYLDYLKHLKESVETLREIVEKAKAEKPLDSSLASVGLYTKHLGIALKKQVTFVEPCETSTNSSQTHVEQQKTKKTNEPMIPSTGVKDATTSSRSKPRSNTKKDMTLPAKSDMKKVEYHSRNNKSSVKQKNRVDSSNEL
ncbi:hypothetical protein Tco_0947636 [Tanacetum coccineum]